MLCRTQTTAFARIWAVAWTRPTQNPRLGWRGGGEQTYIILKFVWVFFGRGCWIPVLWQKTEFWILVVGSGSKGRSVLSGHRGPRVGHLRQWIGCKPVVTMADGESALLGGEQSLGKLRLMGWIMAEECKWKFVCLLHGLEEWFVWLVCGGSSKKTRVGICRYAQDL
jgi:hypothetical protein